MYGYRQQATEQNLMTNLNSISSSLSSVDTVGRRGTNQGKASVDNLITQRSHSVASTSLLWRGGGGGKSNNNNINDNTNNIKSSNHYYRGYANGIGNNGRRYQGSEIYYNGGARSLKSYCFNSETALNFILLPLLLLTIARQVFDFLGQIWLQILISQTTIILLIVALFGIRQHRISYLLVFSLWALFNTLWNIIVICIHTKLRDVGLNEDALSFHTGASSWWHSNGPGCLPYNISSIQPSISILQPITGCRIDYHLIESTQAAFHAFLSLTSALLCCCLIVTIKRNPSLYMKSHTMKSEKLYRLNNLLSDRSKVNQDPFPNHASSRFGTNSASLKRAANKTSSRSSQHSISSMRSSRRRNRQSIEGTLPTPRGSVSSVQRSQKYGSLSSRRSNRNKVDRRGEISSLTYGTTGERPGTSQRTRLSSLSSVDYLPSYQPPHSSSANLLSSYGEISSIDSYNNRTGRRSSKNRQASIKTVAQGSVNPTYNGSRSSVCSHNTNANNYDDLSYIYGTNAKTSESLYGAPSTSATADNSRQRQQIYQNRQNSVGKRSGFRPDPSLPQQIHAETYENDKQHNGDTMTKAKMSMTNGTFLSFSNANHQQANITGRPQLNEEINNNYQESYDKRSHINGSFVPSTSSFDSRSRATDGSMNPGANQSQIYTNQRNLRHPIYSNHNTNGNSETPI